jgi:hypothetical protein
MSSRSITTSESNFSSVEARSVRESIGYCPSATTIILGSDAQPIKANEPIRAKLMSRLSEFIMLKPNGRKVGSSSEQLLSGRWIGDQKLGNQTQEFGGFVTVLTWSIVLMILFF